MLQENNQEKSFFYTLKNARTIDSERMLCDSDLKLLYSLNPHSCIKKEKKSKQLRMSAGRVRVHNLEGPENGKHGLPCSTLALCRCYETAAERASPSQLGSTSLCNFSSRV